MYVLQSDFPKPSFQTRRQRRQTDFCKLAHRYELNCVLTPPPKKRYMEVSTQGLKDVALFESRVFADVVKFK